MINETLTALLPKSGKALVADAIANGYKVEVTGTDQSVSVWVERSSTLNLGITFSQKRVFDTPMSSERLGFRTTSNGSRVVMRFDYGTVRTAMGYTDVRSVRQGRGYVGLPI